MKKIIFLLTCFLATICGNAQWQVVNSPSSPAHTYSIVEFIDDSVGFIGTHNSDLIYKTTNAGSVWQIYSSAQIPLPIGVTDLKTSNISFPSDSVGYLYICSELQDKGWLYKTINQGVNWSLLRTFSSYSYDRYDMSFVNNQYGVVFFKGHLFNTTDGGDTWDSTFVGNSINSARITAFDTSYVRVDFNINISGWRDSTVYSNNFCDSIYGLNVSSFSSLITSKDSVMYGSKYTKIYKSLDYGLTWDSIFDFSGVSNIYGIYCYSKDTVFIKGYSYTYRSIDGGITWGKQMSSYQSSYNSFPYKQDFSKGENYLYSINESSSELIRTSNLGGGILPVLKLDNNNFSNQCPGDTLIINHTNDPSFDYYWTLNGQVIDTSYNLNFIIPQTSAFGDYDIYLVVDNGIDQDSIKVDVFTLPSSNPEAFTAWVDPVINCDGSYDIHISPVYQRPSFPYNLTNTYQYFNGTSYFGFPAYTAINGDTLIYTLTYPYDSILSIRAISNYCGGGTRDTTLIQPTNIYDFDLYPIDLDRELYCLYDSIRIKVPYSNPEATYSLVGQGYQINSVPTMGNGDTLELIAWGALGYTENYSLSFYIKYEDNKGCIKVKYDTAHFEVADPRFDFINDSSYNFNSPYYYLLGDTLFLDLIQDTVSVDCAWTIDSDLFDTTYSNCNDHYIILNNPGNYSVSLIKTTQLGCVFESETLELFVASGNMGFSTNLNCAFDTAYNTSWDDNWFQTLDLHQDKNGNFHIAGFYPNSSNNGYNPVSVYEKLKNNKESIYRRVKAAYSNSYWNNDFQSEHLNSVTTDENLNVYTSGQFSGRVNFRTDSTIGYTAPSPSLYYTYAFIAKHDSLNNIKSCILYAPQSGGSNTTHPRHSQPGFSDMVYIQNKVYALFNCTYSQGDFLEYDMQSQNWINSINVKKGMHLIELDSSLSILNVTKVTSSYNTLGEVYNTGSSAMDAYNTRAAKLSVDKQGRILIHYVSGYHGPNGFDYPIEYGNNVLISNYYLRSPHSVSALATYDIKNGWMNGTLVADGFTRNHNYVINNLESDVHGNKYVLSNFNYTYYTNNPTLYQTSNGVIGNDTVTHVSSTISKLDVNGNFIWNKHFQNCDVVDMRLTSDEKHFGIVLNAEGNTFSYGESDTSMLQVNLNGNSTVFMQFNNYGILEKMYEYGNGIKTVTGQFLHFDDDGYFQLNAKISNLDSSELVINGDTIFNPPLNPSIGSTFHNYVTFSIDGENGQCSGPAYSGSLNDTLFLHIQNLDLCADSTVFIPWIATDTINTVNLGYYLNGSSTKINIASNLNATDYGYLWTLPNFSNLDSIKFFVESISPTFYDESNIFIFHENQNIIQLQDTTICYGDSVVLTPLDTFDLTWAPTQYFSDPESDSAQTITLQDTVEFYITGTTNLNGCVNHDTVNVNVIQLPEANFTSYINSSSLSFTNQSNYYDSITWNITDTVPIYNEDSVYIPFSVPTYNVCLIAENICATDTECVNLTVAYSTYDTTSICSGDSILLENSWQQLAGDYVDTLNSVLNIDSIVQTTLFVNPVQFLVDTFNICFGDSMLLGGSYQNISGTYYDTLQTFLGCDSILENELIVEQFIPTQILDTSEICIGDSLLIFGNYETVSGVYYDSLQTVLGCDSVIGKELVVNSLPTVNLNSFNPDTLCETTNMIALPIGTPSGGFYTGVGVSGGNFDPASAGVGTHQVYYNYIDVNSCEAMDSTTISVVSCVGIEEYLTKGISIYPNPFNGFTTINFINPYTGNYMITVYDIAGKMVYNEQQINKQQITLGPIEKGIYILNLINNKTGEIITKKLISQ